MLPPQSALIFTMVMMSAADQEMTDEELQAIGDMVAHLPIFDGFDPEHITQVSETCAQILETEDGLETGLGMIRQSLPDYLHETCYALACDITAADGSATQEELRFLEMLRHELDVDRLTAAAIERGARARYTRMGATEKNA
ncbi:MAG: tellurite resistance TerB family protein [Alphaproteobacteria bacterium]|nr:tellurite resistance TerB family protein [Alphaproteobacteria bacterium]